MAIGVRRTVAVSLVSAALVAGCVSNGSCSAGGRGVGALSWSIVNTFAPGPAYASCAAGVEYEGRFYQAWSNLPVSKGELLGDAAYPPCNDGNGCDDDVDTNPRPTQVWAMRGVDPTQVVVGRREGSGELTVFGRLAADPEDYFRFSGGAWHVRRSRGASAE